MAIEQDKSRRDDRSYQLARLGWLLHASGVALLLLGAAVYFSVFHAPISANERALGKRVASLTRILEKASGVSRQLAETNRQLDDLRQRAAEVRERIPDDDSAGHYLRCLSEVATTSGVKVSDFSRLGSQQNASFSQTDIRVECEGSYRDICRFLDGLEQIPRVARVVKLEIAAAEQDRHPLDIVIRLYHGLRPASHVPQTTQQLPDGASGRLSQSGSPSPATFSPRKGERHG